MEFGIEIDLIVTLQMELKGKWKRGSLLKWQNELWVVLGYEFWGWDDDCGDEDVFYNIVLMHIASGLSSCFPLVNVSAGAELC